MGHGRWNAHDWKKYADTKTAPFSIKENFEAESMHPDFDPKNIEMRESRDSESNPQSNGIIIGFDETGSMGEIPNAFVRKGLGTMVGEIIKRKPVTDPHIMIMGIGDASCDQAPLQVTQFETDLKIAEQLKDIYLEGGGGANKWESYNLAWYFAALRTSLDCLEKRRKKGYLFTVGDEMPPPGLETRHVKKVFGDTIQSDLSNEDVLGMVSQRYEVFHLIAEEGGHCKLHHDEVFGAWRALLGQRAIALSDHTKLAECVVSTIQVNEGADPDKVSKSWSGDTSLVVARAMKEMTSRNDATGIVRF